MEDVIGSALGSDVLGEAVWYIEPELIVVVLRIMREALDGSDASWAFATGTFHRTPAKRTAINSDVFAARWYGA